MKNIRLYKTELNYNSDPIEREYPTVSYCEENSTVYFVKRETPNRIIATYAISEDQIGQSISLASDLLYCSDIILDGNSLNTPISIINSGVVTPTSYGIYSSMTFTEDSWVVSPEKPWEITFDKPLQAGDMIGISLFVPEFNEGQNAFMPYEQLVSEGILTTIEPNNTQKFTSFYITTALGVNFNVLMCAFTPIDENGTVTEDNFIGATYVNKSGGSPSSVDITPTEATIYTVEYIFPKENVMIKDVKEIGRNAISLDLSSFDTSKVTSMYGMFIGCSGLTSLDLSNFDTSKVTNMIDMFSGCTNLTSLDLSSFNTSKVTNMGNMFDNCSGLTSLDLSNFDTSKVTNMRYMFAHCSGLTSLDLSSFDTSNVTNMTYMFYNCRGLTSLDVSNFDTSKVTNMYDMFRDCSDLTTFKYFKKTPSTAIGIPTAITSVDFSGWDASNVTSMSGLCRGCTALTSVTFGENFDTSKVTDMAYMFRNCSGLTSIDLSSFNTSKVTNMSNMFDNCRGLTSIDLNGWNTSNVTNMSDMFRNCGSLTSVTFGSQADVSKVTDYSYMFSGITTSGTLYYPSAYADAWNNIIVTNQSTSKFPSTWTPTAINYENQ